MEIKLYYKHSNETCNFVVLELIGSSVQYRKFIQFCFKKYPTLRVSFFIFSWTKQMTKFEFLCIHPFILWPRFLQFLKIWFEKSGSRIVVDQKKRWFYTMDLAFFRLEKSGWPERKIRVCRTTFLVVAE